MLYYFKNHFDPECSSRIKTVKNDLSVIFIYLFHQTRDFI